MEGALFLFQVGVKQVYIFPIRDGTDVGQRNLAKFNEF